MTPPLVTTAWLAEHLQDPGVRIVDASYFVAGGVAEAQRLYADAHIQGAAFFDIDAFADTGKTKIHAFPTAAIFAEKAGELGIGNQHHVVAYDRLGGTCAAARAWFMFQAFGHDKVSVLDGGLDKWIAEKLPLTKDMPSPPPQAFHTHERPGRVVDKSQMLENIQAGGFQVLDARSKGRFEGTEPEPRAGLRGGRIPASCNLPFANLIDPTAKTWKDAATLRQAFAAAGIDLSKPLTTTCGSGVSACALAFGAYIAGKTDTVIYDGSWVEWGADGGLPAETGPVR